MRKATTLRRIKNRLLGKPLNSTSMEDTRLGWFWGLPQVAGNSVSSVAYAVEEILVILIPVLGFGAVLFTPRIALPIIVLLVVLVFSYRQIIKHYPGGAGSYHVASDTLGRRPAITAAAALVVDYTLTVAVSMAAAVAALGSAFPLLSLYKVPIAVAGVLLVTLVNLRGSTESSRVFGIPTYAFILIMFVMIGTGIYQAATGNLQPLTYAQSLPEVDPLVPAALVFLMLRAFAGGSIALTGIESASISVSSLREPRQKNAQIILFAMAAILIVLFGGTLYLARVLEVAPIMDSLTGAPMSGSSTVLAQMGQAVFGVQSPLFYFLQIATALVMFVSASSAFSDMPNLLATLARDGYAPHQFGEYGAKLTLSNGIFFLTFVACALLIFFRASVHELIPLYAVGVFLSFTISQAGMARHWTRDKGRNWKSRTFINGVGAVMAGVALIIVFTAKFIYGAWTLAFIIPLLGLAMFRVRRHYDEFHQALTITPQQFKEKYHPNTSRGDIKVYIPISKINLATLKNINFANQLSHSVHLVHVARDAIQEQRLIKQYKDFNIALPLIVLDSPFRDLATPIVNFLDEEEAKLTSGKSIAVVTSRFTFSHYYDNLLHNQTSYFIQRALRDYKEISVVMVPFHLNLQKIRDTYVAPEKSFHRRDRLAKEQKLRAGNKKARGARGEHGQHWLEQHPEIALLTYGGADDGTDSADNLDIRYRRVGFTEDQQVNKKHTYTNECCDYNI